MTDQDYEVILKMEKYGGNFVQSLAICFQRADWVNFKKLKDTFSEYWKQYEEM